LCAGFLFGRDGYYDVQTRAQEVDKRAFEAWEEAMNAFGRACNKQTPVTLTVSTG